MIVSNLYMIEGGQSVLPFHHLPTREVVRLIKLAVDHHILKKTMIITYEENIDHHILKKTLIIIY